MLTLTSKHKYDKKKNINMSTGKEKNNLNILSGFLRPRCMYRTIPKFLVHHLSSKNFSSGVLPCTPVHVQGVLFGMKQAGINQGFWVVFLGLIPWFSTITHCKINKFFFPPPLYSELFKSVVPFFFYSMLRTFRGLYGAFDDDLSDSQRVELDMFF